MLIPEDRVHEVQNLIGEGGVESVTESKAQPIEDIRRIVERWGELGGGGDVLQILLVIWYQSSPSPSLVSRSSPYEST